VGWLTPSLTLDPAPASGFEPHDCVRLFTLLDTDSHPSLRFGGNLLFILSGDMMTTYEQIFACYPLAI
jgi:hypothetical protein